MEPKPIYSAGARFERKCMRQYLQRKIKSVSQSSYTFALEEMLQWVRGRQDRYDKRKGGL